MKSEDFNCPVCLDIVDAAVECTQCGNIFCHSCSAGFSRACPSCRYQNGNNTFRPSLFVRKIVNTFPAECENKCAAALTRGDLQDHAQRCPLRSFSCSIPCCQFKGKKDEFFAHIIATHESDVISRFTQVPPARLVQSTLINRRSRPFHEEICGPKMPYHGPDGYVDAYGRLHPYHPKASNVSFPPSLSPPDSPELSGSLAKAPYHGHHGYDASPESPQRAGPSQRLPYSPGISPPQSPQAYMHSQLNSLTLSPLPPSAMYSSSAKPTGAAASSSSVSSPNLRSF